MQFKLVNKLLRQLVCRELVNTLLDKVLYFQSVWVSPFAQERKLTLRFSVEGRGRELSLADTALARVAGVR